jgi:hypothetical protein
MRRLAFLAAALAIALHAGLDALPSPDPSITFTCPNYDSIRVHRVNWQTRENVYVRTIPATCNDSTAVSPGFLR